MFEIVFVCFIPLTILFLLYVTILFQIVCRSKFIENKSLSRDCLLT